MADSSQELMVKIRGDSTGAEAAFDRTSKRADGLNVSTQKLTASMRQFVNDLKNARDGSDVLASAAAALGKVLAGSLAGTAVVIAGKVLLDTFNKVKQTVDEARASIENAMRGINAAGKSLNLAEAQNQANGLYAEISKIESKVKEIESSPLQKFIAGITGAKDEMAKLAKEAKEVADRVLEQGVLNQRQLDIIQRGFGDTDKAAQKLGESFDKLIVAAMRLGNESLKRQLQDEKAIAIAQVYADAKKKQAEEEALTQQKLAEEKAKIDQKDKEIEMNSIFEINSAKRAAEEAERKAIEEARAIEAEFENERKQRHLNELQRSADRIGSINAEISKLQERAATLQKQSMKEAGERAMETARRGGMPGPFGEQRKTSLEVGMERRGAHFAELARKQAQREERANIAADLRRRGEKGDGYAVNREIERRNRAAREMQAKEGVAGTGATQKQIEETNKELKNLESEAKKSSDAASQLSEEQNKNKENYFDINKNSESLVEKFLEMEQKVEETSDALEKLNKELEKSGKQQKAQGEAAGGGRKATAGQKETSLSDIYKLLEDNLKELRTYAFVE